MQKVSPEIASKFCMLCNWAYESWLTHKHLFDDNKKLQVTLGKTPYFASRLSIITQEYSLLQICKLHDAAIQQRVSNLTIDYIFKYGGWGSDAAKIQSFVSRLTILFEKLRDARNKILAHNDISSILGVETLGAFPEFQDVEYFLVLQEFANAVHIKWLDVPYPFNDLAGVDVDEFLRKIEISELDVP
jgi:hypothetical protein